MTAAAKSLRSCLTLCDPIDGSPPGSPVPGILQARTLEWVAMAFSNAWKWKGKGKLLSRVRFFPTPWTAAYLAPPLMGFSRQEDWSGVPLPSPVLVTIAAIYSEYTIFFTKSVILLDCPVLFLASRNQYLISFFFPCLFEVEISPRPKNPLRNSTFSLTLTLLPEFSCLRLWAEGIFISEFGL